MDVKKTIETGETTFVPGLLANAHRGILYVDDINLLDTDLVTTMLQAITDGFVIVEREGISVKYPCKPILIATFNPVCCKCCIIVIYILYVVLLCKLSNCQILV